MPRLLTILIDGKPYRGRALVQLRKEQLAARQKAEQLMRFADLPKDSRPA